MRIVRKFGMYLSLTIISVVHAVRYWTSLRTSSIQGVRVILVQDRKVVLVTHWYAPWTWTLPGGGVNKNETPEAAAIREVKEETGFDVKSLAGEIGKYKGTWGRGDMVAVYYTGDFGGSLALTPNIEIMGRSWFDIDNLPEEISPANRRRIEAYRDGVRGEVGKW
ncbi:NUDIX domain-containing protein [Candidatus Kaiserbacteria bacterium]|nr:NUDIX domain-containing protein [Candidatus Kaiserbacteria bacterium]